jgi:hypothetical protein
MWYDSEAVHYRSSDDVEYGEGFKADSMLEQLLKITDGAKIVPGVDCPAEKYKPLQSVVTDDGDEFVVNAAQAEVIYNAVINVPTKERLEILEEIQTTKGLTSILEKVKLIK